MNFFVFLVALIAGFAGFMFGFDSSLIADVKDQIMNQLNLTDWQWSQTVSASLLGCMMGIPISGYFINRCSTRFLLKGTAVGFIVGSCFCAFSDHFYTLLIGRFLVGICIGISSYAAPLFIAEVAPANRRGSLIMINGLTITFGQSMAYLVGYVFHDSSLESWRYLFLFSCTPAFLLFMGMLFVPHPPRWVLQRQGFDSALAILKKIRPSGYDVMRELNEMHTGKIRAANDLRLLLKKPVIYVVLLGITLGCLQQLSGINAILYYGPAIFESAGFFPIKNAILATFCIGIVNFAFTVFTTLFIDRLGRRLLLLSGTLIATLSLFAVSILFNYSFAGSQFWILMCLVFYTMGYCISVGSLFWILIAEIYPATVRGMSMSLATIMKYATNFLVSISFLSVYHTLGEALTFAVFASFCLLAYFFVYYFVPETRGISLEKIEKNLIGGKKIRDIGQPVSPKLRQIELALVDD